MVSAPWRQITASVHMQTWGDKDSSGNPTIRIVPAEGGPGFIIPVVIDDEPQFQAIEGHNVENPVKKASFSSYDWYANVPSRDPGIEGDVLVTPDGKKYDIGATSITNDKLFVSDLYVFRPR